MPAEENVPAAKTDFLKGLREARKAGITAATARMKEQRQDLAALKGELQKGGKTVPELAAATGIAPPRVLWYLATLKKYGEIVENGQDGSYFRYQLAAGAATEE